MKLVWKCLSRSPESNNTQHYQRWPDLTFGLKFGGRSNFEIDFLGKIGYQSIYLHEKTRPRCICCSRINSLEVIKKHSLKNSVWPCRKRLPLAAERLTWGHIWYHVPDITFSLLPLLFADWSYLCKFGCQASWSIALHVWPKMAEILYWWRHLTLKILTSRSINFHQIEFYASIPTLYVSCF